MLRIQEMMLCIPNIMNITELGRGSSMGLWTIKPKSMMMSEKNEKVFIHHQAAFLSYWQNKEPAFILYYKQEYLEIKSSKIHCTWISLYRSRDTICISSMSIPIFAEKWALCYINFDHHDIDTNVLVER